MTEIRFTGADLDEFAATVHDRNPLHCSDEYARTTPFGQRVVFGALSVIAALGALPTQSGRRLTRLVVAFHRPLFAGVSYAAEAARKSDDRWSVRVLDGSHVVLRATADFRDGVPAGTGARAPTDLRGAPVDRAACEIVPGLRADFGYAPGPLEALSRRYALPERGVGGAHLAALAACSYLVGMEIPGLRALFSGLSLEFEDGQPADVGRCAVDVEANDDRFDLITLRVRLPLGAVSAHGEIKAYVRPPAIELDPSRLTDLPPPEALAGKVAVVVGASRGIGAALALALARCGATVTATYAVSGRQAEALRAHAQGARGEIEIARVDAADADAGRALRDDLMLRHGRLDVLALCASPPLLPMDLSPITVPRLNAFVASALSMAAVPLANLLAPLSAGAGRLLVFSSAAVTSPPADWPHYVAAKCAIEGLARSVAAAHPRISVTLLRPPRVLTDLTNAVGGRAGALHPESVAAAVVRDLVASPPGGVRVLEDFGAGA